MVASRLVRISASVAAAALMAMPLSAQVINGGFENPVVPSIGYALFPTGTTFSGWSVSGPGNVAIVNSAYTYTGFLFPAHSGDQWLDLTGDANAGTTIEQVMPTIAGNQYSLSFWIGNQYQPGGPLGTFSRVEVYLDGAYSGIFTNRSENGNSLAWEQFFLTFTAQSDATTVGLYNSDPAGDGSNALDDVSLTAIEQVPTTTTPEPASLLLLATAMFPLGALVQRRRRLPGSG